ncbi:hypothetical protein L1787_06005 [Acuticoccus sp. M5D2P5]|uniref:hypothetical protein n=1 Tax=Acuticoccus kalidii TaxID=2910977 RepID=UPI001F35B2FF|nr:hypothetical protein [Acuticoccus kalidii]MCF3932967.1 hypothetical protein [Acuticoccus kalidii]
MPKGEPIIEVWMTAGGVCMTPEALAVAADVPTEDVLSLMGEWSARTRARAVYEAWGERPKLTVEGVELMLALVTNDKMLCKRILGKLTEMEKRQREMP